MLRSILATGMVVVLLILPTVGVLPAQSGELPYLYVYILDTSKSMIGYGGSAVIFPHVKQSLKDHIDDLGTDASIYVFPFDKGIHDKQFFHLSDKGDIEDVKAYIDGIKAEGMQTWIYRSFNQVSNEIREFLSREHEEYVIQIHLYTDGKDTDSEYQGTMDKLVRDFDLIPGEYVWLYYKTINADLEPGQRETLEDHDRIAVVEVTGEVPPILQIRAVQHVLNYGNLWEEGSGKRTVQFRLPSKGRLPAGLRLSASLDYPDLQAKGLGLALTSESEFEPRDHVDFAIKLVNFVQQDEGHQGDYEAAIKLESSDPHILIMPSDRIPLKFRYNHPPRPVIVNLSLLDADTFDFDLGELSKSDAVDGRVVVKRTVLVEYSQEALDKPGRIEVSWRKDMGKNPAALAVGDNFRVNGQEDFFVFVKPPEQEIVLEWSLPVEMFDDEISVGKYEGQVRFSSDDYVLRGMGLVEDEADVHTKVVGWSFELPKPPLIRYWWHWLILILIIVALGIIAADLAYYVRAGSHLNTLFRSAKIPDGTKLEIREPAARSGETIDISGGDEVVVGEGGVYIPEASGASFKLIPKLAGHRTRVRLLTLSGEVFIKRAGEREETRVFDDKIIDGDSIRFGEYTVRVSSFMLSE